MFSDESRFTLELAKKRVLIWARARNMQQPTICLRKTIIKKWYYYYIGQNIQMGSSLPKFCNLFLCIIIVFANVDQTVDLSGALGTSCEKSRFCNEISYFVVVLCMVITCPCPSCRFHIIWLNNFLTSCRY